jgi:hypothetical protein
MEKIALKSSLPPFSGKYRIVRMKAKPSWIPTGLWLKLYHMGLLEFMVKERGAFISNKIMFSEDYGVNLFLKHLGGDDTYPLELDTCGIGTGTTAPSDTDTALETPAVVGVPRATVEFTSVSVLTTEWFFTNDELPNDTYTEFALYTGTQIFCRSIISPSHTKGSNEDTLVEYIINAGNNYTP